MATGGSDEKVAQCLKLGADVAVNYRTQDVRAAVAAFAPAGVNLFWETLREPDFDEIVSYLAERGRIILMAGREARPPFPVGPFYVKGCSLHGFVMFKAPPDVLRQCAEDMNRSLATGQLSANIARVFPLSRSGGGAPVAGRQHVGQSGNVGRQDRRRPVTRARPWRVGPCASRPRRTWAVEAGGLLRHWLRSRSAFVVVGNVL